VTKTLRLTLPHRLSAAEARRRIDQGINDLRSHQAAQFAQVQQRWTGDHMDFQLTVMAQSVTGRVDVTDQAVNLEVDLPWALAMLADRIRPQIEQQGRRLLEKK
jgi:hypothetical protein